MQLIASRALRAIRYGTQRLRSDLRVAWYRALYPNLRIGRQVRLGKGVHIHLMRNGWLSIGDGTHVEDFAHLVGQGRLEIGAGGFIGAGTMIVAAESIEIGDDALIAALVTIRDQDHVMDGSSRRNSQPLVSSPVRIGNNVWIGTKATILRGTVIGDNAVVGAHALVRSEVPPSMLVAGVPARVVKELNGPQSGERPS